MKRVGEGEKTIEMRRRKRETIKWGGGGVDMSCFCSVCEKSFSRKDDMQRHVMSQHRNAGLTPFQTVPMSSQKCQQFRFEHPFTSMIARMTGSGKTTWVRSPLHQASETIYLPPEKIVWCYSQWQPAYTEMLVTMPHIKFVKGIPTALEQDSYFHVNKRISSCLMIRRLTPAKTSELWTSLLVVLIIAISAWFVSCRIYFIRGKAAAA